MFKYYGKYAPYLFLLPSAVVLVIFFFIPFFQTFLLSFLDYSTNIYKPEFIGVANYVKLFHNPVFYKVFVYCCANIGNIPTIFGCFDKSENQRGNTL